VTVAGVRVEFTPAGNPVKHGGAGTAYANYGCRCDECTAANAARVARRRAERATEEPPADAHGNASTYTNWRCRCDECTAANSEKCKTYWKEHHAS
jgi:hypothetical protein